MLQLGLMPSHFSFLFLQIMHARRFGLGTLELPPAGASIVMWSSSWRLSVGSDTMMVSGGVSDDVDMPGNKLGGVVDAVVVKLDPELSELEKHRVCFQPDGSAEDRSLSKGDTDPAGPFTKHKRVTLHGRPVGRSVAQCGIAVWNFEVAA